MEPLHPDHDARPDGELWSIHAESIAAPGPCPAPIELAAYLGGRCDEAELDVIETHLASCGECLDAVVDLRATDQAAEQVLVPRHVLDAARSVIAPDARTTRPYERRPIVASIRWGLAAAASIAVSIAGYSIGMSSSPANAGSAELASDLTFGLLGTDDDEEIELVLFAMAAGEVSR